MFRTYSMIRIRLMVTSLALVALVYSLGACPGGCLESNRWIGLAHRVIVHDDHTHEVEASHCHHHSHEECDCEIRELAAIVASCWQLPDFQEASLTFVVIEQAEVFCVDSPSAWLAAPPTFLSDQGTLRAQRQLFRC